MASSISLSVGHVRATRVSHVTAPNAASMPNTLNWPSAVVSASTLCRPIANSSLPILDVSGFGTTASGMDMNACSAPHHAARYAMSEGPNRLLKLECDGGETVAANPYNKAG